jgi:hypothetical protein
MVLSAKTRREINNNRRNHNYWIGFVAGDRGWGSRCSYGAYLGLGNVQTLGSGTLGLLRDFCGLVHQVSDWGSGVAIKMGRRQGATKEHI